MKRPLAVIGFTMLGTLCVFSLVNNSKAINVALAVTFVAFLLFIAFRRLRQNRAVICILLSVIVSLTLLAAENKHYDNLINSFNGRQVTVTGSLYSLPYTQYGKHYYVVKTEYINCSPVKTNVRIVCNFPIDVQPSDEITCRAKAFTLGESSESYLRYYRSKELPLGLYLADGANVRINKNADKSPYQLILCLRKSLSQSLTSFGDNDYSAVMRAILLGEKSGLSDRTETAFRLCGISHLFAVSGLHISIWSALLYELIRKIRLSQKQAGTVSILFCVFFIVLTGMNPPVIRAGFMLITAYASMLFSREADWLNSIGLALCVMLTANPFNAVSVSLWLSLLATLGILSCSPKLAGLTDRPLKRIRNRHLRQSLDQLVSLASVTVSVSVFTLPVYMFTFGKISLLTLVSNLAMVMLGALCMELAGISALLISLGLTAVGKPVLTVAAVISKALVRCTLFLSEFRYSLVDIDSDFSRFVFAAAAVSALVVFLLKVKSKKILRMVSIICCVLFVSVNLLYFVGETNSLNISEIASESGVGVSLSYKRHCLVISSNISPSEQSALGDAVNSQSSSRVDCLVIADGKTGGSVTESRILSSYKVDTLITYYTLYADTDGILLSKPDGTERHLADDELTYRVFPHYAEILFYQTKIVILFSDDIILDDVDADVVIRPDASAHSQRNIRIFKNGRVKSGVA